MSFFTLFFGKQVHIVAGVILKKRDSPDYKYHADTVTSGTGAEHLVERKNYDSIPPKVEYSLSERGKTLIPILKQIHELGKDQMDLMVSEAAN